jgi:hypothetical protein
LTTLPGAKLYFYETGTSTPKTTWTDPERATASAHPVVALSDGTFPPIFINGIYRVELKNAAGVTQPGWPVDDVGSPASGFPFQSWSSTYSYSEDDLVIYDGEFYQSLDDDNVGNTPSTSTLFWVKKLFLDAPTAESYLNGNVDGTYTWRTIAQTKSDLALPTDTVADLALKAPLASPTFTGNPQGPTPAAGDNSTSFATTAFVSRDAITTVANFSDLATTPAVVDQVVFVDGLGEFIAVSGSGNLVDEYESDSATGSVYWQRINYEDTNILQYYLPAPKPFKKSAILDELKTAYDGLILGGGYYGAGALASDWVYETALNNSGGTNGTFNVRARFGRTIDAGIKAGGNIIFNVQMGSNVAGVSCVAYSFASNDLPSTGRATRGTLVNGGGGLFSVTVAASGAWSDYLGIEVNMVPVNTANDATLHQETWVVKRVWMTQAAVDIMDTNVARISDGANLAQLAVKVKTTTFWPEQISYDTSAFLLNHSRYMTGATVAACWVAASGGASTGYGLISAPVTLARAASICLLGVAQRFIFKDAGVYAFSGVRPTNIFPFTDTSLCLLAPNGDVELQIGNHINMGSLTWASGGFDVPYTYTNNYAATNIAAGTSTPKLIREGEVPLTEVALEADVATTPNSYFWKLADNKFIVNIPDLTIQLIVPECDSIISATNAHQVKVIGVYADAAVGSFIKQLYGDPWCEFYGAGIYGGTINESIFRHENSYGFAVDCFAHGAGNDGYNYHNTGGFRLFDCVGMKSLGDGVSPHEDCTLEIIGGEFSDNVRAGVIPAYGANCICFKVTANDNAEGLNQYGNFMALSDNSVNAYDGTPQEKTKLTMIECTADGGDYGIVSRGVNAYVYEIDCTIDNQDIADIGSYDSSPSSGYGHLIVKDRVYTGIDFTEGDKVSFIK